MESSEVHTKHIQVLMTEKESMMLVEILRDSGPWPMQQTQDFVARLIKILLFHGKVD